MDPVTSNPFLLPRSYVGADASLLVIAWPGIPKITLDVSLLDSVTVSDSSLLLTVDDLEVGLYVADGSDAAGRLCEALHPYTRRAAITRSEVLSDAERRLRSRADPTLRKKTDYALWIGAEIAHVNEEAKVVAIGDAVFSMDALADGADRGQTLTTAKGGRIQAGLLLLLVAAAIREGGLEGFAELEHRVSAFKPAVPGRDPP